MIKILNILKKTIDAALSFFLILIFVFLVICVVWQVLARWMGISSLFTDETARYMFIWVGLFGAAYAHGLKRHLAIDVLLEITQGLPKAILQIFVHLLVIVFAAAVMIYGGGTLLANTLSNGQITPTLQIPMWIIYLALPLSGGLIAFYSLYDLIVFFFDKNSDESPEEKAAQELELSIKQGGL